MQGRISEFCQVGSDFHAAILTASQSPLLIETYERAVHWRFAGLRTRLARDLELAARSFGEHRLILDLAHRRSMPGLIEAITGHIGNTNTYFALVLA